MNTWVIVAVGVVTIVAAVSIGCWLAWRTTDPQTKALVRRIGRLSLERKVRLAFRVARDRRVPLVARAIPIGLVAYLALPIDLIPDFIPVLGQLDDILIILVAGRLLLKVVPRDVIEEVLTALEATQNGQVSRE